MSDVKIDLESFLDELVSELNRRLKRQDTAIASLERDIAELKSGKRVKADKSVLKVLRGK